MKGPDGQLDEARSQRGVARPGQGSGGGEVVWPAFNRVPDAVAAHREAGDIAAMRVDVILLLDEIENLHCRLKLWRGLRCQCVRTMPGRYIHPLVRINDLRHNDKTGPVLLYIGAILAVSGIAWSPDLYIGLAHKNLAVLCRRFAFGRALTATVQQQNDRISLRRVIIGGHIEIVRHLETGWRDICACKIII